ncbi:MAG: type IX secretion system sortase PorU, partial [candidate division KSB1 bacterium]|nr:type IX secretion system sortase PorU [candidate division KSB1 bacterium]
EGPLYKFALREEGIYRIDGQTLASNGIALAEIQPSNLRLFNNGGRELPRDIRRPRPQGLVENAIYVSDGGDGRFDANDFILFYGRGVEGFAFDSTSGVASHYINHYGFDNYYWLNVGGRIAGKRMAQRVTPSPLGLAPVTSFRDYLFVEEERTPLFESDQTWYGWLFTNQANDTRTYKVRLTDPVAEGTLSMRFAFYAPFVGGFASHFMAVNFAKQDLVEWQIPGSSRPQFYNVNKLGGLVGGDNDLVLTYRGSGNAAQMYIDYFEMSYDRQLRMGDMLIFNGQVGAGPFAYRLSHAEASQLWLFEVSDFSNVNRLSSQNWQVNGTQVTFADAGSIGRIPRRYIAATPTAFKAVDKLTRDEVSNWRSPEHAADMIIITHEDFLSINPVSRQDQGPLARFVSLRENHRVDDRLDVEVAKIQDVFDEFSCGMYDPVAIRDFLKYAYDHWRRPPLFVLLVGDGDYDPKNIEVKGGKNWIPTYHTDELDDIISRVTDSWYTYVAGNDAVMDMAIGRIPARSLADVEVYVDKIIKYETVPAFGPWRNTAVMVADDELGPGAAPSSSETVHIRDTEILINTRTPPYLDVKKLYLTEYAAVQSASISGIRKPSATETLLRLINNGSLLVNYVGHGNSEVWSHERVLNLATDFQRIQNGERQALWVAATCTFGKFDKNEGQSFSEELIFAPRRGAIAVVATARDVFANQNAALNQQYYRFLFENNQQISARIGMALVLARMQTGITVNDEKFHVLGDPSLRIGIPRYSARIQSVKPDTIKALAVMTVSGNVQRDGVDWLDFNGTVRLEALDSRRHVSYQSPGGFTMNYTIPGNALFRGEAPVQNGRFNVQFFVPKDITYGGQTGRINLYFWNSNSDGNGYRDNLPVGGTIGNFVDRTGPEIEINFLGVENFRAGGVVGKNPVLRAIIADTLSGVNITGEIGHKITLTLDGREDDKIDITDLFNYVSGSYTRGTVVYPLGDLPEGRHTAEINAWDNLNNSNTAGVEFVVRSQDQLSLHQVLNYPNP